MRSIYYRDFLNFTKLVYVRKEKIENLKSSYLRYFMEKKIKKFEN